MPSQPNSFEIRMPGWMEDFLAGRADGFPSDRDRMALVISAARINVARNTGGPFAAAVFESGSGKLVSLGVNLVVLGKSSILHAEMVAFALAQKRIGGYDLGRAGLPPHELVTSVEPCAMCLGAIPWSGVRRVVIGAAGSDAQAIGFDEGAKPGQWKSELEERGIDVVFGVMREAAAQVLTDYAARGGKIYGPRN
jgi:tRNA(Arg) A34 adenosine deaminase TadA